MIFRTPTLIFAAVLYLQGCGSSVLIKQESTNTVNAGRNAITEINKFHNHIFDTQNQLAASLIARYPSCKFGESIVIRTQQTFDQNKNTDTLCLSDIELKSWQSAPPAKKITIGRKIDLNPLERSSLKSSMDILEAFSTYLDTIAKHTAAPETPIAGSLKGVVSELTAIQEKVKFLPDNTTSKLAQSTAITDFIGYLEKLIKNSKDSKLIAKIIESEGGQQEKNLLTVAAEADGIFTTYIASMSSTLTTTLGDYYNKNKTSKEFETLEKRQSFLVAIFKQKQLDNQIHTSSSPGSIAIRKFVVAHGKLRDSISGNYSEEQRAFIIDENISELKSGLQAVASLIQFAVSTAI
ncbi:MAG: hypothetical protein U1A62_32940 [Pseudomonas sp.]|nr:hypothetical protein [Pseudomonas sp.]